MPIPEDKLVALARYLYDEAVLADVPDVIYFFEKPWKYEAEYAHMEGLHKDSPNLLTCTICDGEAV